MNKAWHHSEVAVLKQGNLQKKKKFGWNALKPEILTSRKWSLSQT